MWEEPQSLPWDPTQASFSSTPKPLPLQNLAPSSPGPEGSPSRERPAWTCRPRVPHPLRTPNTRTPTPASLLCGCPGARCQVQRACWGLPSSRGGQQPPAGPITPSSQTTPSPGVRACVRVRVRLIRVPGGRPAPALLGSLPALWPPLFSLRCRLPLPCHLRGSEGPRAPGLGAVGRFSPCTRSGPPLVSSCRPRAFGALSGLTDSYFQQ